MPRLGRHWFTKAEAVDGRLGERNAMEDVHLMALDVIVGAAYRTAARLHHQSIYHTMHLTHINPEPHEAELPHDLASATDACASTRHSSESCSVRQTAERRELSSFAYFDGEIPLQNDFLRESFMLDTFVLVAVGGKRDENKKKSSTSPELGGELCFGSGGTHKSHLATFFFLPL
jgi:hypothetical protein